MERITLAHGGGGRLTQQLIEQVFLPEFEGQPYNQLDDAAILEEMGEGTIVFTTDSFVVQPVFFPGGDIGRLAVSGTVNDLAVCGASPRYLTAAFIIEEGFPLDDLRRVVRSMARTAAECGVRIVAGDTKVVEKGAADGVFINTTGIGIRPGCVRLGYDCIQPGDKIIINGPVGEHGIAVISKREGIDFETEIKSDCAPLNGLIATMLAGGGVRFMRDPTRGGLAGVLNEVAAGCGLDLVVREDDVPVTDGVMAAADMLGFDPLYLANEGKVVAVVSAQTAEEVVNRMRSHPLGKMATIIGEVTAKGSEDRTGGKVYLRTPLGGHKLLDMPSGEQLPRIC